MVEGFLLLLYRHGPGQGIQVRHLLLEVAQEAGGEVAGEAVADHDALDGDVAEHLGNGALW